MNDRRVNKAGYKNTSVRAHKDDGAYVALGIFSGVSVMLFILAITLPVERSPGFGLSALMLFLVGGPVVLCMAIISLVKLVVGFRDQRSQRKPVLFWRVVAALFALFAVGSVAWWVASWVFG